MVALRDLLRQVATTYATAPCRKRAIQAAVAVLMWLMTAVVVGSFAANPNAAGSAAALLLGILFVWTPGLIAYAWATAPSAAAADRPIVRSRVALLYDKYFGLNGEYFGLKVQASQLLSVVLQAWTRLPLLGAFVSVHPRLGPFADIGYVEYYDEGGSPSAPIFWTIFAALVVNALYPAVLLVQRDAFWSRRAVAVAAAALDLVYSAVFFFAMLTNGVFAAALPIWPLATLSLFYPTVHVVFVCRAIEAAAADLAARARRAVGAATANGERRASTRTAMALTGRVEDALPLWKGARFAAVALGAVAAALGARCADRYPLLSALPGPCAPCVCSDAGVLRGCPYHAELSDPILWISGRGVTEVKKGALEGNEGAINVYLHENALETLPAGVFGGLRNPRDIRLDRNKIAELPPGLFDGIGPLEYLFMSHNRLEELPPGLFDALGRLRGLDLRSNRLRHLPSETFRGLQRVTGIDVSANNISHPGIGAGTFANPDLAFVSLAHNPTLRSVEAGAFGESLEHVWLTGSNLTCARLAGADGALPSGAGCADEGVCGAVWGVAPLGNGFCDEKFDPRYNTAECLWDGGDCA